MTDADLIDRLKRFLGELAAIKIQTEQLIASLLASQPDGDDPSDEDRIRDAMTEAHDHPGRIVTR